MIFQTYRCRIAKFITSQRSRYLVAALLIPITTSTGWSQTITTFAGGYLGENVPATEAALNRPNDVIVDGTGRMYIADTANNLVRRVDTDGTITTFAGGGSAGWPTYGDGGPATDAPIQSPVGLFLDSGGNLFIAESQRVRKVDPEGTISTVAGGGDFGVLGDNGPATEAGLNSPTGLFVDQSGILFIAERWSHRIRKVDTLGTITTLAGNGTQGFGGDEGPATDANLNSPSGVYGDDSGAIYIADQSNNRIRKVDATGTIRTVVGTGETFPFSDGVPATEAAIRPLSVFADKAGNIFFSESSRIRKVDSAGIISTVAGGGSASPAAPGLATNASLSFSNGIHIDAAGNLYIADANNYHILMVDASGSIAVVAGGYLGDSGPASKASLVGPEAAILDASGNLYIAGIHRTTGCAKWTLLV